MSSLQQLNKQLSLTTVIITFVLMAGLLLPTNISQLFIEDAYAGPGGQVPRFGRVMTRGLELSEAGNPIWAEIGEDGKIVADINEAVDVYKNARTMSVISYLSIVQAFDNFKEQYKDTIAKGAVVMTRAEYEAKQFEPIDVPKLNVAQDDPDKTRSVAIPKLDLRSTTETVYVRSRESVINPELLPTKGAQRGMILFEAPIDLRQSALKTDFGNNISLLLDDKGNILHESANNIGYKTGFFKGTETSGASGKEEALGPIVGAEIDSPGYSHQISAISDAEGKYFLNLFVMPCPGFTYFHEFYLFAKVNFINFDPEAPSPTGYYYYRNDDAYMCSDLSAGLTGSSLIEQMTKIAIQGIENSTAELVYARNFYVDLLKFNGIGFLSNEGSALPFGETKYSYTAPPLDKTAPQKLDLNLDRVSDVAQLNSTDNRYYDVFLDGQTTNADGTAKDADLQRVADVAPDFTDQGLLESISATDLKETDIYIYRVSNGKIVTKKKGLKERDLILSDTGFVYDLLLPGPLDDVSDGIFVTAQSKTEYQEAAGYTPDMIGRRADFLRAGEEVKIIAINRPTGYIGSVTTTVHIPTDGSFSVKIDDLVMRPPNLKVKVERMYTVEAGLSKNDDKNGQREYLVGFEGGALTTDTAIEISTEWFDHDGSPLPDELEGYTGRVAKVTGTNSLDGGDVNNFQIEPGSRLQVLTFAGDILGSEHLYIHVSGYPEWRNPGVGAGDGKLAFRPKNYVPIKAPILDEVATRQLRDLNRYNKQDENPNALDEVEAVYQWPYRPEMQFSVYDLTIKKITRTGADNSTPDSYLTVKPILAAGDKNVTFVYDLMQKTFGENPNAYEGLALLGADKDLVFAFGEHEILATFDKNNQKITFDDFSSLALLSPEEYLSIRLYQNNDAENILWEWAFGYFALFPESNADLTQDENTIEISADDAGEGPIVINAFASGFKDELLRVNWNIEGVGSLSNSLSTSSTGIFNTALTLSTQAGDTAVVSSNIEEQEKASYTPLYKVVPGLPAWIGASQTGSTAIGGNGAVSLSVTVKDKYENLVPDGTVLTISSDDVNIENVTTTVDGVATFDAVGKLIAGTLPVEITVGNISHTEQIQVHDIQLQFANLSDVQTSTQTTFNIQANSDYPDLNGVKIDVAVLRGRLSSNTVTLDSEGNAQVTFDSGRYRGFAQLSAKVASSTSFVTEAFSVQESDEDYLQDNILVADGSGSIDLGNGQSRPYSNVTNLVVHGQAGETVNPSLASIFKPAVYALLDYNATGINLPSGIGTQQTVLDYSSGIDAAGNNLQRVYANNGQDNLAWVLDETSYISVPEHTRLQSLQSAGINLRIKLGQSATAGTLIDWDDFGVKLITNADGTLTLTADTETGPVSVTTQNTLTANQWHQLAAHVYEGELKLGLDDEQVTLPLGSPLQASKTQDYALKISFSDLITGTQTARLSGLKVYDWQGEAKVSFANGNFNTGAVFDATGTAQIPLQAHPTVLAYTRSFESKTMLASISGRMLPTAFAQTQAQQSCIATFEPISPDADDPAIEAAEGFLKMMLECFIKPKVEEVQVQYETATGFKQKSVALVQKLVMEGAYAVLKQQAKFAIAAVNCIDAALTGSNSSTVGATCDFITSILAVGDIRDLLIQSWHYSIGDPYFNNGPPKFDPLTASLSAIGLIGSGATLISGPAGGSIAVIAATGKVISKTFKKLGPVGKKAADTLGTTLGKIVDNKNLTVGQKVDAVLRYSPIFEIGASLTLVYNTHPKVFKMFGIMLSKEGNLERLTTWLSGYLVRLGEELIARIDNIRYRLGLKLIPTADAAISTIAKNAIIDAFKYVVKKSDNLSTELLTEHFDEALEGLITHLDEAGSILSQGAKEESVIKAFMNIARIADENTIRKFAKIGDWSVGNLKVKSEFLLKALGELPEEAMEELVSKGIKKSLNALDRAEYHFVKGNMFELASYLSAWKIINGKPLRKIVETQVHVGQKRMPNKFLLPVRYYDEAELIGNVKKLIELKNYSAGTWQKNFIAELGIKVKKVAADEADDVVSGQMLTDLVRHVEHVRGNIANFPNPTGRRMAPSVLGASDNVANKTAEMNKFVFDHIKKNANDIAKRVYGLDLSKGSDEILGEWGDILETFRSELIDNKYIKIDTLANLAG